MLLNRGTLRRSLPFPPLSLAGQPLPGGHLALIGEPALTSSVLHNLLQQANKTYSRMYLVGTSHDQALLDQAHELNPVRAIPLELQDSLRDRRLRHLLDQWPPTVPTQHVAVPLLVIGRGAGGHWFTVLSHAPHPTMVLMLADASCQLRLPLYRIFQQFLVAEGSQCRFEAAIERWHRHDQQHPQYTARPYGQQFRLYSKTP